MLDQSAPFPLEDVSTLVADTLVPAGEGAGPPEQLRLLVCIAQWGDRNSEEMKAVLAEYDREYGHFGNSTRVAFGSSVDLIFAGVCCGAGIGQDWDVTLVLHTNVKLPLATPKHMRLQQVHLGLACVSFYDYHNQPPCVSFARAHAIGRPLA